MAFGGLGGIAGGILVQPASIHPAGRYVSVGPSGVPFVPAEVYPALVNDLFWRKSGPGSVPPGIEDSQQGAFQYISIASIATGPEPNFLSACDTDDTTDEGTLVTHIPLAGQHGLPVNYGRGRNRWRPGDEDFINVWFRLALVCQDGTGVFGIMAPEVVSVTFVQFGTSADALSALGDLRIRIGNRGGQLIAGGAGFPNPPIMNVQFMHTIQR